jgi:hypothetical protein
MTSPAVCPVIVTCEIVERVAVDRRWCGYRHNLETAGACLTGHHPEGLCTYVPKDDGKAAEAINAALAGKAKA